MLTNYLKIAFRNLWRERAYTAINLSGLAIGMACALLAILFVRDELSYDQFHVKAPQLYRLTTTVTNSEGAQKYLGASGQVQGPAFKAAIPEVTDYARVLGVNFNVIGKEKSLGLQGLFADASFPNLFTFPLLHGDWSSALTNPNSIVITEEIARKFFGKTEVVGELLKVEDGDHLEPFVITGVTEKLPANSSIQFELLLPFQWLNDKFNDTNWLNQYLSTFLLLHPDAEPQRTEDKFVSIFQANAREQLQEAQKNEGQNPRYSFGLQPIADLHLNRAGLDLEQGDGIESGVTTSSTLTYSYILLGIVGLILLMACVNFINLSLAGAMKRAKEIGIRKVVGSSRRQVIGQFMAETTLLCLLALVLACVLCAVALPIFNQLADKELSFSFLDNSSLILGGFGLLGACVLATGLYPAVVLSVYNPTQVLYNRGQLNTRNWFGKGLTVAQFVLAIGLVAATLVYFRQMNFMTHKELGYDPTNIIRVKVPPRNDRAELVAQFRQKLQRYPVFGEVAMATDNSLPVLSESPITIGDREVKYVYTRADYEYLPLLDLQLTAGRNFSTDFGTDPTRSAIVNESFVKAAGWADPIGKQFTENWIGENRKLTVVGVVKDYHYGSLRYKIQPQVMTLTSAELVWIKYAKGQRVQALTRLQDVFQKQFGDYAFQYSFLSDDNANLYQNDRRWQQIIQYAAVLSILICSIGLFGLARMAANQRTKEIGVRKVLGASVASIVALLSKDFLKLVLIAIIIASPLAWYALTEWLADFAYKIDIEWWYFALAGGLAVGVALLTVSYQSVKAALMNPVESLRSE
ncbi:ABC transporter permease [Persicitalea sp.]|uniref:ABC transporter permease n=1 Tax=Persicitalea sp. TaxID=3100273 RepID=UPI0035940551